MRTHTGFNRHFTARRIGREGEGTPYKFIDEPGKVRDVSEREMILLELAKQGFLMTKFITEDERQMFFELTEYQEDGIPGAYYVGDIFIEYDPTAEKSVFRITAVGTGPRQKKMGTREITVEDWYHEPAFDFICNLANFATRRPFYTGPGRAFGEVSTLHL